MLNLIEFIDSPHSFNIDVAFCECFRVDFVEIRLFMLEGNMQDVCQSFHSRK